GSATPWGRRRPPRGGDPGGERRERGSAREGQERQQHARAGEPGQGIGEVARRRPVRHVQQLVQPDGDGRRGDGRRRR
ncbi:hypothetical protein THAOC_11131, partial [Thalassiosira oceanica]